MMSSTNTNSRKSFKDTSKPRTLTASASAQNFSPRRADMYRYSTNFQTKIRTMEIQNTGLIRSQEKDVEIERLKTTCYTLNK